MKKYLMTGIAALALCFGFTSCSHDVEPVSQEDLNNLEAQKVLESYNQAFIQAFGQPAANQDWGFGTTRGITRANGIDDAINVNGNEWTGAPAVEVPDEVNAIYDYVKYTLPEMTRRGHLYDTNAPENLNGYFVTQVRNGLNSDNKDQAANGQWVEKEGEKMNHLQIAFNENPSMDDLNGRSNKDSHNNISGWEHINNFNASQNANWANDQSELHGNTKVVNKGAHDFAYHNSLDSKYHNNWILIDGYNITADHRYANYYYVCFDFESMPDGIKTRFTFRGKNSAGNGYQDGYNGTIDGYYKTTDEVKAALAAAGTTFTADDGVTRNVSEMTNIVINKNNYEHGSSIVEPDDIHTDWIIRITKGAPQNDYDGRIMAEDLSAVESGDFDFNDVVFDYKLLGNETAEIQLRAAGGTLELYVGGTRSDDWKTITGGYEVHERFDVSVNQMVNTGVTTVQEPDPFVVDCAGNLPVNIKIWVKKNGVFHELTAHTGQPASKFRTACTTKWCDEYISISNPYSTFKNWVNDTNFTEWTTTNFNEIFADKNLSNNEGAIKGRY